jgi:hypothetical protein
MVKEWERDTYLGEKEKEERERAEGEGGLHKKIGLVVRLDSSRVSI